MSDFEDAKLILTPNAYKAGKAYCVKPFDGSGDLTVVRNTTATARNSSGNLESVAVNVPRLNYPIGGGCPSWLIEPQSTNVIDNSYNFFVVSWTGTRVTNGSTINAPNGNNEAHKLIATAVNNTHYREYPVSSASSGSYTGSCFFKKGEFNVACIRMSVDSFANRYSIYIDLNDGSFLTDAIVGSPTGTSYKIEDYGNGWYRLSVSIIHTSGEVRMGLSNASSNYSNASGFPKFLGNNSDGGYSWGAQLEQGGLTSYIPTNGSTVTRNADVFSKTGISSLIGQTEGSVFIHAKKMGGSEQNALSYFSLSDNSSSNRLRIISGSSDNTLRCIFQVNGNQLTFDYNNVPFNVGGENKLSFRYKSGDMAFFLNGVKIGDSTATLTISNTLNLVGFTNHVGGNELDTVCEYQSLLLFPTAKSDAELINLTTI